MKKIIVLIKEIVRIIAAMGGILLDKFSYLRVFHFALLVVIYFFFRWLYGIADFQTALAVFLTFYTIRYLFLFLGFVKGGFAGKMKDKWGEEKGFQIYQTITAVMFFAGGMSFTLMIIKSGLNLPLYGYYGTIFTTAGYAIALAGFVINVWATYLVGIDIYYYKDLFVGRKITEFKNEGPYKIFSNPMYGPGQANGYGTALTYGSAAGLTGMLMNQVMMYIFFYSIEKPHIIRILKAEKI
jgi:hypothetical protein